jgi:ubiquinone/menaquinone biosynthesis C-methylase UbiE
MIDLAKRSLKKELLDGNNIPFKDIVINLKELDFINTHLGGHSITIKGFQKLLQKRKRVSLCEIGCGGGDNLRVIEKYCKKKKIYSELTGIDINNECIKYARQAGIKNINFIVSDYKKVIFENKKPDIIFCSLFCHHFSDEQLIEMMNWMKKNSMIGFFINDLQRNLLAYYSIKFLTGLFSKSYLVKNDAPLSVLRGFTRNELKTIFERSGIKNYEIKWNWAYRYLITVATPQSI